MKKITFNVIPLTTEKAAKKIGCKLKWGTCFAIKNFKVDLPARNISFEYNEKRTTPAKLKAKIEKMKYTVNQVK
ncbi:hypothetical protein [Mesoplasma lactucae]|uniref:Uncharacterized protein n=1 Tax=Mesoplasma lactucae ATCC 49193 TaxID=81460 RepID=A0A291IR59_9MOLU|nr:hypothetical protein [Mesoplasma lactucae]ATG97240.1 hypothetical protein CP520_00485 [Mesoplasma lactucae ATCC 49193]ATZ20315.1 hypothetical protein MLACT_v1c04940 [Mesoplasma lactucae ATCC 49193]MCL8216486.1 hypothetical protein [Mesoplasma lactucae ATCC 49193]